MLGTRDRLGEEWPHVVARVGAALRSRGVAADRVPDLLQEVAVRALRSQPAVRSTDELAAWCYVVATRLVIDEGRARTAVPLPDDIDLRDAGIDLHHRIEGRAELDRVWQAMATLSPQDRATLLAMLDPPETGGDRRSLVRDAVRRHRARARLVATLERLGAVAGVAALRVRRWGGRSGTVIGLAMPAAAIVLVSVPVPPATPVPSTTTPSSTPLPTVAAPAPPPPTRPSMAPKPVLVTTTTAPGIRVVPEPPPPRGPQNPDPPDRTTTDAKPTLGRRLVPLPEL